MDEGSPYRSSVRFFDYLYAENDYLWQRGKTIAQRQEAMDNRRSEMLENRPENPDIGEKKRAALLPRQKSVNFSAWQREWLHLLQERDRTLRQLIDQVKKDPITRSRTKFQRRNSHFVRFFSSRSPSETNYWKTSTNCSKTSERCRFNRKKNPFKRDSPIFTNTFRATSK